VTSVLIVDIDGTVAPYKAKGCSKTYRAHLADICVPEVITDFLRSISSDSFWLSYRSGFIPHSLQQVTGMHKEITLDEFDDKYDAIASWAKTCGYSKIVWVDDDYDQELERELADSLQTNGIELVHIVPLGDSGLTWADREQILEELQEKKDVISFRQHFRA